MNWLVKKFNQLTTEELYDALKLRVDVFVVEQTCYYPELDDKDRADNTLHILVYDEQNLAAYLRILPPDVSYPGYVSIGRVATASSYRGQKLGHQLVARAVECCAEHWPNVPIKIGAQEYLETFYQGYGFARVSEMYLEDGIPHIDMIKES